MLAANPQLRISRSELPRKASKPIHRPEHGKQPDGALDAQGKASSGPQKPRKYRNEPVEVDGRRFASKKEANRYQDLVLMQRAGEIRDLVCQWRYSLDVSGVHVCFYVADFVYMNAAGTNIVEDCKGMRTPLYKLKAKLMFAVYGIKILET